MAAEFPDLASVETVGSPAGLLGVTLPSGFSLAQPESASKKGTTNKSMSVFSFMLFLVQKKVVAPFPRTGRGADVESEQTWPDIRSESCRLGTCTGSSTVGLSC